MPVPAPSRYAVLPPRGSASCRCRARGSRCRPYTLLLCVPPHPHPPNAHTGGLPSSGFKGKSYSADVAVHPSGRFAFTTNRGHDTVAVFTLTADGSVDTAVPTVYVPVGGQTPRGFGLAPGGDVLVVAHQHSRSVVAFDVDAASGALTQWGAPLPLRHAPVCVKFV
jgi:6-phosphogluconolactonase (cycloisomerase 2 family)